MRWPTPATLLSRPIYLVVLLPFAILLHLLTTSSTVSESQRYRPQGLDARVGWSSDYTGENAGFAGKAGAALSGIGDRLGRLAAGKPPLKSSTTNRQNPKTAGKSIFRRTGGSLHELVALSSSSLYDARTSLDKLRLTSTRFVAADPPSPFAVFSQSNDRQHILVTGGFSSLGRALVRDLLLLGENNGAESEEDKSAFGDAFNLGGWWGGKSADDDDWQDDGGEDMFGRKMESERLLATANKGKKQGIVVTLLDTTNRSLELDDMLKHAPLYHRSRVGFNLPSIEPESMADFVDDPLVVGGDSKNQGLNGDQGTPPLKFIDPRSAAFSSSEVSLASFIAKGRLRIIRADARNVSLLTSLLNPHQKTSSSSQEKPAKSRFGIPKRPHHQEDEAQILPPISGVYHLAGYEASQCVKVNARDCADLERNSVRALATALGEMQENARPWVVLGDRGNLDEPKIKQWLQDETSAAGQHGILQLSTYMNPLAKVAQTKKVHGISLRLPPDSHIFGDSFASRTESPVAHLVHSAIGHLPIVVDEELFPSLHVPESASMAGDVEKSEEHQGAFRIDARHASRGSIWQGQGVVYIDDIAEGLLAAGELLSRSNRAEYLTRMSILGEISLLPPSSSAGEVIGRLVSAFSKSAARETVDWIVQLTKSSSPVGYIKSSSSALGKEATPLDRTLTKRVLGTTPSTPLPLALKAYIRSLLGRQTSYLDSQIGNACAPPPDLQTLNNALTQLDTCSVQILGLVSAENMVLACNSAHKDDPTQSPLILSDAVPTEDGSISQVKLHANWGPVGRVDIGFFCPFGPNDSQERLYWTESTKEVSGQWVTASEKDLLESDDPTLWAYKDFEVNFIRRDTRSMTLSIPQYPQASPELPKRRMVFTIDHQRKGKDGGMKEMLVWDWQTLAETTADVQTMEWRLNPICCGKKEIKEVDGFTFLREDPLYTSQILYPSSDGSTTVAESTYEIQRCRELRSAHDYSKKLDQWNERTSIERSCPRSLSEGSEWIVHDLPICSVDCHAPISCLVTDKCRCTRDRCGQEEPLTQDPIEAQIGVAYTDALSYPYTNATGTSDLEAAVQVAESLSKPLTLPQQVEALPWDVVVQPSARQLFSLPLAGLPKVHVVSLPPEIDTHMSNPACYDLSKADNPTMADHFLVQALQLRSVPSEDASFAVIPYYQGCYRDHTQENTYKKLADTVATAESQIVLSENLRASNIVLPFLHDWGSCTGWWPQVEQVLPRTPPPPMSKAISWQVNGDLNTRCIKAERDVIVPAASKHTSKLLAGYSDLTKVARSSTRKYLAFNSGKAEGYGAFAATRLDCGLRSGDQNSDILYNAFAKGSDYVGTLGQSKFCLLPRGVAGWSSETFDAIYAGCIPVFIADRTSHPFNSILAYSSFSLAIPENQIHTLRTFLSSISEKEMDQMQIALLKVREAFVYADDPTKEWTRRGPMYFTLLAMAEKLALQWPTLPVQNACRK